MSQAMPFAEVLEAADHLSFDEQQELVVILNHRLAEAGRARVVRDVAESEAEFARGECQPVSVDEIMREILE